MTVFYYFREECSLQGNPACELDPIDHLFLSVSHLPRVHSFSKKMSSQRNIATRWGKRVHTGVANLSSGTSKQQTLTERQRGRKREEKTQLALVLFFLFMKELLQVEATVKSLRPELSSVSRGLHWEPAVVPGDQTADARLFLAQLPI